MEKPNLTALSDLPRVPFPGQWWWPGAKQGQAACDARGLSLPPADSSLWLPSPARTLALGPAPRASCAFTCLILKATSQAGAVTVAILGVGKLRHREAWIGTKVADPQVSSLPPFLREIVESFPDPEAWAPLTSAESGRNGLAVMEERLSAFSPEAPQIIQDPASASQPLRARKAPFSRWASPPHTTLRHRRRRRVLSGKTTLD